jgi:hypothetical protein
MPLNNAPVSFHIVPQPRMVSSRVGYLIPTPHLGPPADIAIDIQCSAYIFLDLVSPHTRTHARSLCTLPPVPSVLHSSIGGGTLLREPLHNLTTRTDVHFPLPYHTPLRANRLWIQKFWMTLKHKPTKTSLHSLRLVKGSSTPSIPPPPPPPLSSSAYNPMLIQLMKQCWR